MNIERAIHELWSGSPPLVELVPSERVLTGEAQGNIVRPYVTLERRPGQTGTRTSSGTLVERAIVRLNVWDDDLDRAKQIARLVLEQLHRFGDVRLGEAILDFKRVDYLEETRPDGAWRVASDFRVLVRQIV